MAAKKERGYSLLLEDGMMHLSIPNFAYCTIPQRILLNVLNPSTIPSNSLFPTSV